MTHTYTQSSLNKGAQNLSIYIFIYSMPLCETMDMTHAYVCPNPPKSWRPKLESEFSEFIFLLFMFSTSSAAFSDVTMQQGWCASCTKTRRWFKCASYQSLSGDWLQVPFGFRHHTVMKLLISKFLPILYQQVPYLIST